jgi:hypothetical protein
MNKKKFGKVLVCVFLLLPLIGCPMYTAVGFKYAESSEGGGDDQILGDDPDGIETTEDTVTLAWDSPSPNVDYYRLSFRIHGANPPDSVPWYIIEDNILADPNPEYPVDRVGSGPFDFGVVAKDLDADIEESALHSSLDITAQPTTGWYLIWLEP